MAIEDPNQPPATAVPGGTPGISDADIDALLAEMDKPGGASAAPAAAAPSASIRSAPATEAEDQAAIDALLASASFEDPSGDQFADAPAAASPSRHLDLPSFAASGALPLDLPDLQRAMADAQASSIDLLRDVDLNVKIELGRSKMLVEDVLKLAEGSVVELDKLAGDPVDVFVNDRLVARGEVLVLNDAFCVRVNEIVAGATDLG
jgi:flagellar motor switch protein FliN/FliY